MASLFHVNCRSQVLSCDASGAPVEICFTYQTREVINNVLTAFEQKGIQKTEKDLQMQVLASINMINHSIVQMTNERVGIHFGNGKKRIYVIDTDRSVINEQGASLYLCGVDVDEAENYEDYMVELCYANNAGGENTEEEEQQAAEEVPESARENADDIRMYCDVLKYKYFGHSFKTMNDLLSAAKALAPDIEWKSWFYTDGRNNKYVLLLENPRPGTETRDVKSLSRSLDVLQKYINICNEYYGTPIPAAQSAYIAGHNEMVGDRAIQALADI